MARRFLKVFIISAFILDAVDISGWVCFKNRRHHRRSVPGRGWALKANIVLLVAPDVGSPESQYVFHGVAPSFFRRPLTYDLSDLLFFLLR